MFRLPTPLPHSFVRNITKRFNSVLVIADHDNTALSTTTKNTLTAAKKIGGDVTVLVVGTSAGAAAKDLSKASGVKQIITAENEAFKGFTAESITPLVLDVHKEVKATHILAGSTSFGKALIPRVASKLGVSPISEVSAIKDAATFVRPIYAGNAFLTLKSLDAVKVMTIRCTSFEADSLAGGSTTNKPGPSGNYKTDLTTFQNQELKKGDTVDLTTAKIVLSGGRGMGSAENFKLLYKLATKMKAAVGASRAAVDAGFIGNETQIGQTGKIVAPQLYVAFGISGAIQHLAGMKDSKTIVAINKDADAPIFQISDYGLVDDVLKVIKQLMEKV